MRRPIGMLLLAVLALTSCGKSDGASSTRLSGVKTFSGLSHDHKTGHIDYPQTPPVGGPHAPPPFWMRCGVYTEQVPNENAVHSLEHGAVWITYQPALPAADVATLDKLADLNTSYTLISPYPGQSSLITATAWGLQLNVTSASDPRLAQFVKAYAGGDQGGEGGADCAHGITLDQAKLYQAGQLK